MATFNAIDTARPQLRALTSRIANPMPGLMIAGRAVSNLCRAHYRQKDATEPNKLGGDRTHYWLEVARSVNNPQPSGAAQVTVSITHPTINQKIKGGTITAKRAKMLTIPVDPRAHGRRASVLERALGIKLFVIAKLGRVFLAGRVKEGRNSPLRVFYILKKSVNQKPDPTALPPSDKIQQTAMDAFGAWVTRTSGGTA